jgi:thymidylate kinase
LKKYFKGKGIKCGTRHLIKDSLTYFLTHKVIGSFFPETKIKIEKGIRRKDKDTKFYILAFIKKLFLLIEIIYFNLRYGRLRGQENNILICDRYFYDALVQAEYLGVSGEIFKKIYRCLILVPDISFFLKIDPDEAFKRKEEFNISYFTEKNSLYDRMIGDYRFLVISPVSVDKIFERIINTIQGET